ncbi:hypothetical protein Pcinc_026029 [Petrolisthes cinctipes]|uniref:Uncharacterized protein n=1 Tax=Petrolisthes cinctipes TaxID=88211 RepID=A0AAE1F844_PETCI|nr:hypothetical protein Pcinc_026029 [Petrolisthes cinctipes]
MASKIAKPSLLRTVAQRNYAAQAAAAPSQPSSYTLAKHEPKVTTLPSGAVVASLENNSPVSRVGLLFKAGSRYESAKNLGASHMLRSAVGLATDNMSSFAIIRTIQQGGGSLSTESGREHILYSLDFNRDNLDAGLEVLSSVGTQPTFKPWEVNDNLQRIKTDLALRDPSTITLELLHSAAFRNTGLGNSLFVPPHHLGKISSDMLKNFVASTHLAGRMAVVGLGVDHDALVKYASSLVEAGGEGVAGPAAYGSGELRLETGAAVTLVAVAGASAGLGSTESVALAVAQQILGVGPGTKYGSNASSVLAKAVASSGGLGAASSININYSDAGLFGYFVMADSASVEKVVRGVHGVVKNLKVTDADVKQAKKRVKAAILMASESGAELLTDMGLQALLTGKFVSPAEAAAAVDAVTPASVDSALQKVMGSKLSMSVVGSVSEVPYIDQL